MIDLILAGGTVVTMDKKRRVLTDASVAVDCGKILYVGASGDVRNRYEAKRTLDCADHVVLPGFVDAHGHGGHSFFRFAVKDTRYWMPAMTHTYFHYIDDDFWYYEGRVSALERLRGGITTGVCVLGSQPRCDSPVFAQYNAKAYAEVGVRDIVCTGPCHPPWPHNFSRWSGCTRTVREVSFREVTDSLETVIKTLNGTNGGKTFAFVTPFTVVTSVNPSGVTPKEKLTALTEHDKFQAKEMRRIAREYGTRIHSDCFGGMPELLKEDMSCALVGPDVHLQHCTRLSEDEVKILADSGTSAGVCPTSGAPVDLMLDANINMALTTDGTKLYPGFDIFGCMRQFQQNCRSACGDPSLIPDAKALEMVTVDAARALGLQNLVGSIEPGKQADLITVDMLTPKLTPCFNLLHALVQNASGADIDNVVIAGDVLMHNRKTNSDEKEILLSAQREAGKVIERSGIRAMAHMDEAFWGKARKPEMPEPFDIEWQRRDGGHY
ncbi:MAG: amidohydrolase family protein [Oscillospiraceae bacterium]|jgi:cytosine/adenosine deaminase-related metal-dependent hydrolase|nr:amidohydrolase family protein [Oscillospiraceae bacterium]